MSRTSTGKEEELKRVIRRMLVMEPTITLRELHAKLDKGGYHLGENRVYLTKLVRKIQAAAEHYSSRELEVARITKTRERYNVVIERLFKIAFWQPEYILECIWPPDSAAQVKALTSIIELDLKLFAAEKVAGLFQQQAQSIIEGEWRARPMPTDIRDAMIKAFAAHGLTGDRMKAIAEAIPSTNATGTPKTNAAAGGDAAVVGQHAV